jgi:hypothetical protein
MLGAIPGLFAAYILLFLFAPRLGEGAWVVFGVTFGFFCGAAQSFVLGRWVERPVGWIVPTAFGEAALWMGAFGIGVFASSTGGRLAEATVAGIFLGACQWLFLRRWVKRAGWWVVVTTIGRVLGVFLAFNVVRDDGDFGPGFSSIFALQAPLALITGIALITLTNT